MEYFLQQCQVALDANGSIIFSLFLGGLLGSATHCVGMCGPFVMAQVGGKKSGGEEGVLKRLQAAALLPYHLGRVTTYILLGIVGASLSQFLVGTPVQRGVAFVLLSVAGLLFLVNAVPSLKRLVKANTGLVVGQKFGHIIGRLARPFFANPDPLQRYALGILLGFLPCGLVVAAVMAVAATGHAATAAFGMLAFGVGTVPSLFLVGTGTQFALNRWPAQVRSVAAFVMAVNGVSLMVMAGGMVL
ncbi:sulfite exporter TauE/SafE family protein [Kordiimonas sp. SCSIO 12603]|uniref:sulfite exporter TauE/SafE family protein n=1 Tax=Kordiimonas sp. SCSIO 12603 TaxID=2829596 RepID=UPI00210622D9|nr:sulfite exporter TauE/SafE family protein [Kordiimonas sp. SCSIO 12603]UTW59757.1 sulfite exporter TauE/SafE family protein [Kordiimonas sp. SCSIO 12603]